MTAVSLIANFLVFGAKWLVEWLDVGRGVDVLMPSGREENKNYNDNRRSIT